MADIVERLLASDDPCIRYRALVDLCGVSPASPQACRLREAIRSSQRVTRPLSLRGEDGRIEGSVYAKFTGAHVVDGPVNGGALVDWGPVSRRQVMNPFVTLDALYVLRAARREVAMAAGGERWSH